MEAEESVHADSRQNQERNFMEAILVGEQFQAIPGWPRYEASNIGRIRSNYAKGSRRANPKIGEWRLLAPTAADGYYRVTIVNHGQKWNTTVGRLVLMAFVGPCPAGQEVRHLDGDSTNNCLRNLKWGTPLENTDDKRRHGTFLYGSRHGASKLTEDIVQEIRRRRANGEKAVSLGREFGVSHSAISMACSGNHWIHLPIDPSLPEPPRKKLTKIQAREIKSRAKSGENYQRIAEEFRVSPHTVYKIKRGLTWPDLP